MKHLTFLTLAGSLTVLAAGCTGQGPDPTAGGSTVDRPTVSATDAPSTETGAPTSAEVSVASSLSSAGAGAVETQVEEAPAPALQIEAYPVQASGTEAASPGDLRLLHQAYDQAFKDVADSFGESRVIQLRAHGPERIVGMARHRSSSLPKVSLEGLELVTLLDGSEHAYVDPNLEEQGPVRFTLTPEQVPEGAKVTRARAPDDFERDALARLRAGESVVISPDGTRMLGAIRATERCSSCHVVETGDLLGAFSYSLSKRETAPSAPEQ